MKKKFPLSLLAATMATALTLASASAHAQWYVGATAGQSKIKSNGDSLASQFVDLGFNAASTTIDDTDTAYRAFGGYRLHRYVAIEAGYTDLGRFGTSTTVTPAGTFNTRTRVTGYDVSVLGIYPVTDAATVFARVGAFNAESKRSNNGSGSVILVTGLPDEKTRKTSAVYALGATYDLSSRISLRVEASRMDKVSEDLSGEKIRANMFSAGLTYRF